MPLQSDFPSIDVDRRSALRAGVLLSIALAFGAAPGARAQHAPDVAHMSADAAHRAARKGHIILVDIRRPEEWQETGLAEGAVPLDMTQRDFVDRLITLRQSYPEKPLALICRTGNRTGHVSTLLAQQGFSGLIDVREGMAGGPYGPGWLRRGLPIYDGTPENIRARLQQVLP